MNVRMEKKNSTKDALGWNVKDILKRGSGERREGERARRGNEKRTRLINFKNDNNRRSNDFTKKKNVSYYYN